MPLNLPTQRIRVVDSNGHGATLLETSDVALAFDTYRDIDSADEPLTVYGETLRGGKVQSFSFKRIDQKGVVIRSQHPSSWI